MPIVSASFPEGLVQKPLAHQAAAARAVGLRPWCLDKLQAVEFHSTVPAPGAHHSSGLARIFLETAGTAPEAQLREAARLTRAALHTHGLDASSCSTELRHRVARALSRRPAYDESAGGCTVCQCARAAHGSLFTTEPNTHGGSLVHIHVSHNAVDVQRPAL